MSKPAHAAEARILAADHKVFGRAANSMLRRRLIGAACLLGLASTAAFMGAAVIYRGQLKPPAFLSTSALVAEEDDRQLIELIAQRPAVFLFQDGPVRTSLEKGEELLEFFHVMEESRLNLIQHENPVVRLYAAFYIARLQTRAVAQLRILLADHTLVSLAGKAEPAKVASLVISMLCSRREERRISRFLNEVVSDWRLLAVRAELRSCARTTAA